jgi:small conductance mechanosensitive channel
MTAAFWTYAWFQTLVKIVLVTGAGILADRFLRFFSKRSLDHLPDARAHTILSIVQNSASFLLGLIVLGMILSEVGVNIAPLIASAGILGLAVGFGAQTLVKDVISGLFLLLDDTIRTGETVKAAGVQGKVKKIGVRSLTLEDEDGVLHTIPTGSISVVSNFSRKK